MPKRTSRGVFEYGGRDRKVGDRFEVEAGHVTMLLSMGHIEPVEGEAGYIAAKDAQPEAEQVKPAKRRAA